MAVHELLHWKGLSLPGRAFPIFLYGAPGAEDFALFLTFCLKRSRETPYVGDVELADESISNACGLL